MSRPAAELIDAVLNGRGPEDLWASTGAALEAHPAWVAVRAVGTPLPANPTTEDVVGAAMQAAQVAARQSEAMKEVLSRIAHDCARIAASSIRVAVSLSGGSLTAADILAEISGALDQTEPWGGAADV